MIFQKSNPFPKSIYENVAYGPRINGIHNRSRLDDIVERSLQKSALWDEVKDDLNKSGLALSGVSSNAYALPGRLLLILKFSSWTNLQAPSIRSLLQRSKSSCMN